jgi:hypothetical protein
MSPPESAKIGQPSEPGEYDEAMLALLQIIWGDGFLSPGGADASGTFSRADFGVSYGQQYGFKQDVILHIQVDGIRAD